MNEGKLKRFPFNTVIENGYCTSVDVIKSKTVPNSWDVILTIGFGYDKQTAIKFTEKLRGRHKYEWIEKRGGRHR